MQDSAVDFLKSVRTKKLGSLLVGDHGSENFGDFTLEWRVYLDHLEWALNTTMDPEERWLAGSLKPATWLSIEVQSEEDISEQYNKFCKNTSFKPAIDFSIGLHQWPMLRQALDFVVNNLADRIHPRWENP